MKDTIINLTPPIDGVQYGISDEPIKEGDFYYLQSVTTKNMILKASESKISSNCKKIHFSTNPKETRFPYLQLPSKEQEVKRLAEISFVDTSQGECTISAYCRIFTRGFNANPANTQAIELLKHYVSEIDELNPQQKEFGDKVEQFLLSFQPTAKAVRVEMEENNCDGCKAGIPVDEYNYHRMGKGIYPDFMICQKDKYNKIKVETSSEFKQGIVVAKKVIY